MHIVKESQWNVQLLEKKYIFKSAEENFFIKIIAIMKPILLTVQTMRFSPELLSLHDCH